jgi:hypothetical protein
MPLRVDTGVDIPIQRSPNRELLSGFLDEFAVLPGDVAPMPSETGKRLGVQTVSQQPREEWCWAACAEMVLHFFGIPLNKCQVAGLELGKKHGECCSSPAGCDQGLNVEQVDEAFELAGLAGNRFQTLSFEKIRDQINGQPALGESGLVLQPRPVVAGIAWQHGGGHLVVISGWRVADSLRYLKINDPLYTSGDIRYENLVERYGPNNSGRWVQTWADLRRA